MAKIKVSGTEIDVDITEELSEYSWTRPRWTSTRLIAASPFRYETNPSFFVNLETGGWGDSGSIDSEWERGNFPKLLSYLRNETYEESCEFLLEKYGIKYDINSMVSIPQVSLIKDINRVSLSEDILSPYKFRHPYLTRRCISEKVQRFMGIGYNKERQSVTIPWRHSDRTLANIKFRKVSEKTFWYQRGAAPVSSLVYGIDKVYQHNLRRAVVCEAEIDALSWWTCGVPAIALGGSAVTANQLEIIRKSPIESLVLSMDNDKQGRKMRAKLIDGLSGYVCMEEVRIPNDYKDANEALTKGADLSVLPTDSIGFNLDHLFDRYVQK